ncbi:redox-regulated ATPase YchF [Candidatus Woesearchaeota archaeon]|nr:redox-regulated ATPase YchF [Candidatus Woesearchaeota archaeon]
MLVGIVGKPSCGKSTFFKAATLAEAEIANYPFTTIKANHGVGYVKVECADKDFNVKCNPRFGYCIDGIRFVPVDLLDVAGLVPGAHKGQGRGNEFLDDLNQADVLIHVIDVSGSVNEKGEPVEPLSYNPSEDVKFLEVELDMWYFRNITKGWEKFARQIQQENKEIKQALAKQLSFLRVTEVMIEDVIKDLGLNKEKPSEWTEDNLKQMASKLRKITKPMIIAANKVDVPGAAENFAKLQNEFPDYMMIACSAESELALKEAAKHDLIKYTPGNDDFEILKQDGLSEQQQKALEFIKENILKKFGSTGVQQVLDDAVFNLLKYIAIFPGGVNKLEDKDGNVLPDCFLLPKKSTALDFAYSLHTDLGDGFIRAIDVRTKMVVGKEHPLKHRDVIEIISSK